MTLQTIESKDVTLGELFGNFFVVPNFQREYVWGADWNPSAQQVTFESLINIRPRQENPSMEILYIKIRKQVTEIVIKRLGGV